MIRGLYSAASAMQALEQNQEVTAQNLANATVPGYCRRGLAFETFDQADAQAAPPSPTGNIQGTRATNVFTDFEPGSLQHTGNSLDVAVQGKSFFVLEGSNGPLYTRNGAFEMGPDGNLRSKDGFAVTGTGGKISIPRTASSITITENGTVIADNKPVGAFQLATFKDLKTLIPVGDTLFAAPPTVQPETGAGHVQQGFRQGSNVHIVNEMVNMISGMRQYEAAQRVFKALSDAVQQQTRGQNN